MLKWKMMYSRKKICYFGDEHSHTFAAASAIFCGDNIMVGSRTIWGALNAVKGGLADLAVVPLENSLEGTVNETLDGIAECSLYIISEYVAPIHHSLIALKGTTLQNIKVVYSHPQALSQCRKFISKNLPQASAEAVGYTSKGLQMLKDNSSACLALASSSQDLQVIAENVEDEPNNTTRFAVVSVKPILSGNKASVMVTARDEAGALLKVLQVFYDEGISMSKLESRPNREKLGGYNFFIDFRFNGGLNSLLAKLQEQCTALKFLGSY